MHFWLRNRKLLKMIFDTQKWWRGENCNYCFPVQHGQRFRGILVRAGIWKSLIIFLQLCQRDSAGILIYGNKQGKVTLQHLCKLFIEIVNNVWNAYFRQMRDEWDKYKYKEKYIFLTDGEWMRQIQIQIQKREIHIPDRWGMGDTATSLFSLFQSTTPPRSSSQDNGANASLFPSSGFYNSNFHFSRCITSVQS